MAEKKESLWNLPAHVWLDPADLVRRGNCAVVCGAHRAEGDRGEAA